MTEKDIRNNIVTYLNFQGYWVWPVNTGAMKVDNRFVRFNAVGTSDIIGMRKSDGKFVCIEIKTPKRKNNVSIQQQSFIDMVNMNRGIGFVACSIDEVKERLGI